MRNLQTLIVCGWAVEKKLMTSKSAKITLLISILLLLATAVLSACSAGQGAAEPTPMATTPPLPTDTPQPTPTQGPAEVAREESVLYVSPIDQLAKQRLLNVYHIPGANEQKPLVIWAHGFGGGRFTDETLAERLAEEGFVVLSIDWQVAMSNPEGDIGVMREATENAECALRFAAENAEQYGADPENVIWAGTSAGAWLGSIISFAEGDLQGEWDAYAAANGGPAQRVECSTDAEPANIMGYVGNAGPYPADFWLGDPSTDECCAGFLPMQMFSAIGNNPDLAVRIIHGRDELVFPIETAERFAAALQDAGYDVKFLPQDGTHVLFEDQIVTQIQALGE